MSRNIRELSRKQGLASNLFSKISTVAKQKSGLAEEPLDTLAGQTGFSVSMLKGAASFYDFLKQPEVEQDVHVCEGTACLLNGSSAVTSANYSDAGKAVCCGYCYEGGGLLKRAPDGALQGYHLREGRLLQSEMPVYDLSSVGILTTVELSVEGLYRIALERQSTILDELKASNLRGRGGAGFGFAFKCQAASEVEATEKYIVCNADEGDPGAFSDRYLLEMQPHKVMAGMYAAGIAAGARYGLLYIRHEYPQAIETTARAIAEFAALPPEISSRFTFHIIEGAGSYVCGEETALLNSIEGLRPEVRVRPPYPATHGLWGKPTVLSNVETFANIPWILRQGGEAYAAIGTQGSKGTKLVSLDSQFVRPGLYEVDFGSSFEELIQNHAGGFSCDVKALQVGGPLGSVVPLNQVSRLRIDFESFQEAGFALGHGGIIAVPQSFPMIDLMRHLFDYMADESCGKCAPCRLGTAKGSRMLERASPDAPLQRDSFEALLEVLEVGSLCALGGGLPLPIRNILNHFQQELAPFFSAWESQP